MQNTGLRRYLYEAMYHDAIEGFKKDVRIANQTAGVTVRQPVMVSVARELREQVDVDLANEGWSIDHPGLPTTVFLAGVDKVLSENIDGYEPRFGDCTVNNDMYKLYFKRFMTSLNRDYTVDGKQYYADNEVSGMLPISPYDDRFAGRYTIKNNGSRMSYADVNDINEYYDGDPQAFGIGVNMDMELYRLSSNGKRYVSAGPAYTYMDMSGMSDLMSYMSERDVNNVKDWLIAGAMDRNGRVDRNKFMSTDGLRNARAILSYLRESGIEFDVVRDLNPGQIQARIAGTKIRVRLTDVREKEGYVGRVYDDGAEIHFTTNYRQPGSNAITTYSNPTPEEVVTLLRVAMGEAVPRADGLGFVGEDRQHVMRVGKGDHARAELVNDTYGSRKVMTAAYGPLPGVDRSAGYMLNIRRDATARSEVCDVFDEEGAAAFLEESVISARTNFAETVDVERLIAEADEHREEIEAGVYEPVFHGDRSIASIQRSYWDVLTTPDASLARVSVGMFEKTVDSGSDEDDVDGDDELEIADLTDSVDESDRYEGTPAEQVRAHLADLVDSNIGRVEPHVVPVRTIERLPSGKRYVFFAEAEQTFDTNLVARYMTSAHNVFRNKDNLVSAMRTLDYDGSKLMGASYESNVIRSRLVKFNPNTAMMYPLNDEQRTLAESGSVAVIENDFLRDACERVRSAVSRMGVKLDSVSIDDNGIIRYHGMRCVTQKTGDTDHAEVSGEIGQVFAPDADGAVTTKFTNDGNYMFIPGYTARILTQKPGETLSRNERTRLTGYEQKMLSQIDYQVAQDLMSPRQEVGQPSTLNNVYRQLYDIRYPVDFLERCNDMGLSKEWVDAIFETQRVKVRYSDDIGKQSTINAEYRARTNPNASDPSNDNYMNGWVLTDGTNMSIINEDDSGYFDLRATVGSTKQGLVRFLPTSASIDTEGRIIRGELGDKCALMKVPKIAEIVDRNPSDRVAKMISDIMRAVGVVEDSRVCLMTMGGWNFEDGIVVSKSWADKHPFTESDGEVRPLLPGDKLSDFNGNKGVISVIVDPDQDLEEADVLGFGKLVAFFKANPDVDIVMAPFPSVSRFNGGVGYEMLQSEAGSIVLPSYVTGEAEDRVVEGCVGSVNMIMTNKSVVAGTHIHGEDAGGKVGRRVGNQTAWAFAAKGATNLFKECYGTNEEAFVAIREYMIVCGGDMGPDGTLMLGYTPHNESDERRIIELPDLITKVSRNGSETLDAVAMKREFGKVLGDRGGDLAIPFPLKFPRESGMETRQLSDGDTPTWGLPVLSAYLRSGQELDDGALINHDYTNHYLAVAGQANQYRYAKQMLESADLSEKDFEKYTKIMNEAPIKAQAAFDSITSDIISRKFEGKRNMFRDMAQAHRMPNSATAVWTGDARLRLDQIAVSRELAATFKIKAGDKLLVARDPVLRTSGIRYLETVIDERIRGAAVNPAITKPFDGDFDGDQIAAFAIRTAGGKRDGDEKFSVEANLLDLGVKLEDGTHPLNLHSSLDVKVAQHMNDEMRERFELLRLHANDHYFDMLAGDITEAEFLERSRETRDELSAFYEQVFENSYGTVVIKCDTLYNHIDSINKGVVLTGAKGSQSKLASYGRYLGAEIEFDDQGNVISVTDTGHSLATQGDHEDVQYATSVKSLGTGVAGMYSQRGVLANRNGAINAVLEATYKMTQSILQSKHDPIEAAHVFDMAMGPARELWRGRLIAFDESTGTWVTERDEDTWKPVAAGRDEWLAAAVEFYTSKEGLGFSDTNLDLLSEIADSLCDENGYMINIEESRDRAATLDRLAYGGTYAEFVEMARPRLVKGVVIPSAKGLFDTPQTSQFAPYAMRDNIRELERYDAELSALELTGVDTRIPEVIKVKSLVARDTQVESRTKGGAARSNSVRVVKARKPVVVQGGSINIGADRADDSVSL